MHHEIMSSQEYSKKTQLEILEEVIRNQGSTNTVDVSDVVQRWNYNYLLSQKYIEQEFTSSHVFPDSHAIPDDAILVGEKLTDAGKLWRSNLYEQIQKDETDKHIAKNSKKMMQVTLALLVITSYPILRDILSVLLQFCLK